MPLIKSISIILTFILLWSCKTSSKQQEIIQLSDGKTDIVTYTYEGDSIKSGRYSNGTIYYKGILKDGFDGYKERETFQYNFDGSINKYAYYLNDSLRYYRFYNRNGEVSDFGGSGLVYLDDETTYVDTLTVQQKFFQQLRTVNPPKTTIRIFYGDSIPEVDRDYNLMPLMQLPIKNNLSGFLVDFNQQGEYTKVIYWSIEDSINGTIQKGRIWRKFKVFN